MGHATTVGLPGDHTATPTLTTMLLPLPSLRKDIVKVKDEMNRWKTYGWRVDRSVFKRPELQVDVKQEMSRPQISRKGEMSTPDA